jgi:hypothetical protein
MSLFAQKPCAIGIEAVADLCHFCAPKGRRAGSDIIDITGWRILGQMG